MSRKASQHEHIVHRKLPMHLVNPYWLCSALMVHDDLAVLTEREPLVCHQTSLSLASVAGCYPGASFPRPWLPNDFRNGHLQPPASGTTFCRLARAARW